MAPFPLTTLQAHEKHAGGRPSEYRPEYCALLLESTKAEGISLAAFAGVIGVARDTIYEWRKQHREFSDACSRAKPMRQLWWERKLGRSRKGAETAASMFALRNIDPTEWRDVRQVQHQHAHAVQTLTDTQLFAIAAGSTAGDAGVIDADYEDISATS